MSDFKNLFETSKGKCILRPWFLESKYKEESYYRLSLDKRISPGVVLLLKPQKWHYIAFDTLSEKCIEGYATSLKEAQRIVDRALIKNKWTLLNKGDKLLSLL